MKDKNINKKNNLDLNEWKYYNHAMLPKCKPHETPDNSIFNYKQIWKQSEWKSALFAKYTSDWDCEQNAGWYWVIYDTPICLDEIKSKHRYEIKKGISNFDVKPINPLDYPNELYDIAVDTLKTYPKSYRHIPDKDGFVKTLPSWKFTFGAFDKENGKLCGYIIMVEREEVLYYSEQRVLQECERRYINSALVYGMTEYYREKIENGAYIVDGEKNINHITNHQEFLCNKMGFRKAYCKLNIVYRPGVKIIVDLIWPWRNILKKSDSKSSAIHMINGVMKLEAANRGKEY